MNDVSISTDLCQFQATNFHQDWGLEADSWEEIVDNYVNEAPVAGPLRILAQESMTSLAPVLSRTSRNSSCA